MLKYDARDERLLAKHNICCEFVGDVGSNSIVVEDEDASSEKGLTVSYGGDDNEIVLGGKSLPNGIIHPVEHGAFCHIKPSRTTLDLWLYKKAKFRTGENCVIFGLNAWVYDDTTISIGEDCLFATQIGIRTSDHHSIIDLATDEQMNFPASVTIEDHVWISEGVSILKGVTAGKGSIIATRALVNASIPPMELWGGVPAKRLRSNVSWVASHPANQHDVEVMRSRLEIGDRPTQDSSF